MITFSHENFYEAKLNPILFFDAIGTMTTKVNMTAAA
jgi:hypothetical protein